MGLLERVGMEEGLEVEEDEEERWLMLIKLTDSLV